MQDALWMPPPLSPARVRSRRQLALVIVATVLYIGTLPVVAVGSLMSVMAADQGTPPGVVLFILGALALPLLVVAAVVAAWIGYARRSPRLLWALVVPPVWAALVIGLLAIQ